MDYFLCPKMFEVKNAVIMLRKVSVFVLKPQDAPSEKKISFL